MMPDLLCLILLIILLPLLGALTVGFGGRRLGHAFTHSVTIGCVGIAFLLAVYVAKLLLINDHPGLNYNLYQWATANTVQFQVGFLLDRLSVVMAVIVLFISLVVHVYTVGYMAHDPGYARFFSYVSLFTFAMLVLVLANNFLVLFFGWEAVGLVSYLLIGFWFERDSAAVGGFKAFITNRVGDVGFLLALAAILRYFGTLDYVIVFGQVATIAPTGLAVNATYTLPIIPVICLLLFIGACAKSAQVPLHVWLPESMEGPTPISALIHAATMVTAGIYMIARMSPLFEYAPQVLSLILIIGGTTALFMGLVALVQDDIKRVIAYSTISQLGYMAVAEGASLYDAAIFHLITHAFFKALLFLAAGSVILALHHEQNMKKMGGLADAMPVTHIMFLIGVFALCAFPPFAGFYSKDIIIEGVKLSSLPGATYAYWCVLIGAFITPLYSFRALFLTFHGQSRFNQIREVNESSWIILIPLIALALPSLFAGQILIYPMLFAPIKLLQGATFILPAHNVLPHLRHDYISASTMALSAGQTPTLWLALAGMVVAWLVILQYPQWSTYLKKYGAGVYFILRHKYGFDDFNRWIVVRGVRKLAQIFYVYIDIKIIDRLLVNGSGHLIRWFASCMRHVQTGYIYHYALVMIGGLLGLLVWFWW